MVKTLLTVAALWLIFGPDGKAVGVLRAPAAPVIEGYTVYEVRGSTRSANLSHVADRLARERIEVRAGVLAVLDSTGTARAVVW